MFERIKDVDHPDEQMLSVFRDHGVVAKDSRDNLNRTAENRSIYQLVHPGWLVTNRMKAWQGSVGISTLRGIVSGHYICFAPRHQEDPRYLNWLFRSPPYTYAYALLSRGVRIGQVEIDNDGYRLLPVLLPPVAEQRAIADYLDRETARIDRLIEEQQRLIEMLRERRQAVIRSSVPDPKSGSTASDKLGRHTRIGNGSTPRREEMSFWSNGHIPWLNSAVVNQDRVSVATQFVTDQAVAKCHLPLVPAGSILVALTGQGKTRGKATVLDIEATINQHMAYVVPEIEHWNSEYLLWCLTAAYGELRAVSDENGSTKGALTCEDLKQFRVAQVPLDEQRRIVADLDEQTAKIDTLIAETETFIELARERRSALITAAVTGQIDVREVA
ncbi:restriction endonuclease subunit S [Mycobacterium kansasii]|uniref:restriction endonuclease subunit S n=2 Tax=Mycobacterium TaxID=1763 RepID=UPI001CE2D047|nr:restriction endonuclease subunit S [Mycobacterium kansasii]UCA22899.1 restriction endonuclease subunit S [Mycobacterium kansasii]